MRKILWVGDAACDSGFAKATHYTLEAFVKSERWEPVVLGLNYRGDPHSYPYRIYPAYVPGGDLFGTKRLPEIIAREKPDVVVLQNDPWNIPAYMERCKSIQGAHRPVFVGAIAVDGKNCRGKGLNALDHVVFWTHFARDEARMGGLQVPSSIIPLGVDLNIYTEGDRTEARQQLGMFEALPEMRPDSVIFLNVNRNQPRKRLDLTLEYFAEYYHGPGANDDAYLYLHVCPTGDVGYDIAQLAKYYDLRGRVMLAQPGIYHGTSEAEMVLLYRAANVQISTTQGEGWGLTTMEGMACGTPQIVPDWSALGEWAKGAAQLVRCTSTVMTPNMINVIGGVPDRAEFVDRMVLMANSPRLREATVCAGLKRVREPEYRWESIAESFVDLAEAVA